MRFCHDLHSSSGLVLIGLLDFPYHCLSLQWKQYLISGGKVSELQQRSKSVQMQRSSRMLTFFTLFFQYLKLGVINSNSAWICSLLPSSLSPSMAALDHLTYHSTPKKVKMWLENPTRRNTKRGVGKSTHATVNITPVLKGDNPKLLLFATNKSKFLKVLWGNGWTLHSQWQKNRCMVLCNSHGY